MAQTPHSDLVTDGIRIRAAAQFLPDESDLARPLYVFAYRIEMVNESDKTVRLESRHWVIVDANGERQEVRGPGVVGEFPELGPGQRYSYVSRCPLSTSWGTMEGSYRFRYGDGGVLRAKVGRFFLVPTAPPIERVKA